MTRIAFILAFLLTAPWEDAEGRRLLVQRYVTYQQYCDVPRDAVDAFLNAPSMGRFFKTDIDGGDGNGRYACPPRTSSR